MVESLTGKSQHTAHMGTLARIEASMPMSSCLQGVLCSRTITLPSRIEAYGEATEKPQACRLF